MEETLTDPLEISKDPELIKDSQTDIAKLDILVCGQCNEIFHFVEQLQEHKTNSENECSKESKLKLLCENEIKPQVWGFILWKNRQLKKEEATNNGENSITASSAWVIYQRWCKLDENEKNLWINAGQNIQGFHKISTASLHKVKVVKEEKKTDKDPLALDSATEKPKEQEIVTVHLDEEVAELIKKGVIKPIKISTMQNSGTALKSKRKRTNKQNGEDDDDDENEEFIVEKILAKRYNPKRKTWEYEIKWQNYIEETWEPLAHLSNCKELVDEFEERIKTEKEKILTPAPRGRGRPPRSSQSTPTIAGGTTAGSKINPTPIKKRLSTASSSSSILSTPDGGRPTRTSKQKALNQVKQWCGNISDDEPNNKRPFEDDEDSDDSFGKKLKLDAADSEDTDYEEGLLRNNSLTTTSSSSSNTPTTLKKVPKMITYSNGSMKKLPSNVLIPDAKGVVRISHKQLPSLSSGVYIMSKTSGIIKLDPAASKLATSGGQTILKVTPKAGQKIGQAHIKLIKRTTDLDGNKTSKILKPVIKQIKKSITSVEDTVTKTLTVATPTLITTTTSIPITTITTTTNNSPPKILNESISAKFPSLLQNHNNDDSDDGIEELEFPTDLPLPEPDSPPGEFVLDPITGKIAGEIYPVEKNENADDDNVDNIVKLAAADITEDDLKSDNEITNTTTIRTTTTTAAATTTTTISEVKVTVATPTTTTVASAATTLPTKTVLPTKIYTVSAQDIKKNPSILNTAIANSNILQKTLLNPSMNVKKKIQSTPKILNQSVAARPSITVTPVIRSINKQQQQHQRVATTVKQSPRVNVLSKSTNNDHRYGNNKITKRVVNENVIYKKTPINKQNNLLTTVTTTAQQSTPVKKIQSQTTKILNSNNNASKTTVTQQQTTKPAVINMPSLNMDDEPLTVQQQSQQEVVKELNVQTDESTTTAVISAVSEATAAVAATTTTELPTFSLADSDKPMFITGDDGTIYQVAGQNEDGQTILVTQDSNGQQQCLLVTSEAIQETNDEQETIIENQQTSQQQVDVSDEQPVVAQFIRTEPPSPGGTHKVVVMLPDGDVIETQVTPEEYASLALDK